MEEILIKQLAIDYNCTPEEVKSRKNVFTLRKNLPGRRIFRSDDAILKVCSFRDKLLVSAEEGLLDWCKEEYGNERGAWFSLFPNLKKLDDTLRPFGQTVADCHHFYLPDGNVRIPEKRPDISITWFEEEELARFQGDKRFCNALSVSSSLAPDVLAVTAERDGEILGMAGVSADSEQMWQIGIDVTEAGKGLGMGAYLTTLIKEEVLRRGKVPFYGTAETHIKSQRVAIRSGFIPAWAEVYTKDREKTERER